MRRFFKFFTILRKIADLDFCSAVLTFNNQVTGRYNLKRHALVIIASMHLMSNISVSIGFYLSIAKITLSSELLVAYTNTRFPPTDIR